MVAHLVNLLLDEAREQNSSDPRAWLVALRSAKWTTVNTQGGQITSTSVNGKSFTVEPFPGMTAAHIMVATSQAIKAIDLGMTHYPTTQTAYAR